MFSPADRPRAPQHPDAPVTAVGREGSEFLLAVHDHLRAELAAAVRAVGVAMTDARRAADARALVHDLSRGLDPAEVGSYCRRWCRVVEVHHRIEDAALFPELAGADAELQPVLARLSYEHTVIHDLLVRLDALLLSVVRGESTLDASVGDALAELEEGLLSHLAYEEEELLGPIARLGVRV
ncbi:MAG: hypothetical protein JWN88_2392 [Frankiales bacterium]|nr:hypothetical protein [Frankiales bacterium]